MNDNAVNYNIIQKTLIRTAVEPKEEIEILFTGSFDQCKLYLVENYGQMPVCVFLALDITIEAVQS